MEVLYTKYNYHRLPQFQVATSIVLDEGHKRVIKRALTPQAMAHIARIRKDHLRFGDVVVRGSFTLPDIIEADEQAVAYDFIEGPSLDNLLFQAFQNQDHDRYWTLLDEYVQRLRTGFKTVSCPLTGDQVEIERVFGRFDFGFVPAAPDAFLSCSVIDLIFDNVILADGRYMLVDNEWMFPGCVPTAYVLYRSLFEFYELKWREFEINRFVSFDQVARRYGMDDKAVAVYRDMENHFQTYVCGEQRLNFNLRYLKRVETIPHMQEVVVRQNHVIHDQEVELQDLRGKARVLDEIFNSYSYRMVHVVCRMTDRILPPGTRRRRWVGSLFRGMLAAAGQLKK